MVGDNIASDIIGANQFMSPHDRVWMSYLVRTGVWNGETPIGNSETPTETVHGVYDAVTSVLKREHWSL